MGKEKFQNSLEKVSQISLLLALPPPIWLNGGPPCWSTCLNEAEISLVDRPITNEEIKASLWALKPFKAPGPDGLHTGFFQRFWLLVRESIKNEIKHIFTERVVQKYLNKTLITLIPKNRHPETLNNYRPISLCNTIYKMVTKIIEARMRPLPPNLISPLPSAFISSRQGVDTIIIAQELIHSMARKKGRGGVMAIKLDLEKAYDRLERSFIRDTLNLYKFPSRLVSLIMSCVSSSSISILVNGRALKPFYPSRGIRQGDPLSSYLFILCMEVLGALIEEKYKAKL